MSLLLLLGCSVLFPHTTEGDVPDRPGDDSVPGGDDSGDSGGTALAEIDPSTLPAGDDPCREPVLVHIDEAYDGDTFAVSSDEHGWEVVRVIGIDTPEIEHEDPAECYGDEAWAMAERTAEGRDAWLTFDGDCVDLYDRTLAYVHLGDGDDDFYERIMLKQGYATAYPFDDTDTFEELFAADEAEARDAGAGLWSACE